MLYVGISFWIHTFLEFQNGRIFVSEETAHPDPGDMSTGSYGWGTQHECFYSKAWRKKNPWTSVEHSDSLISPADKSWNRKIFTNKNPSRRQEAPPLGSRGQEWYVWSARLVSCSNFCSFKITIGKEHVQTIL